MIRFYLRMGKLPLLSLSIASNEYVFVCTRIYLLRPTLSLSLPLPLYLSLYLSHYLSNLSPEYLFGFKRSCLRLDQMPAHSSDRPVQTSKRQMWEMRWRPRCSLSDIWDPYYGNWVVGCSSDIQAPEV